MQKSRENQRAKTRAGKACMWVVMRISLRQSGNTLPMRTDPNLSERMAALGWLADSPNVIPAWIKKSLGQS